MLADDLRRFLDGEPILARPIAARWERAWKWLRQRPSTAALIALCGLVVVAAGVGGLWYRADQARQRAAVRHRILEARTEARHFLMRSEEAIGRGDWDIGRAQAGGARALMCLEPALSDLGPDVIRLISACEKGIADRRARVAVRSRVSMFLRLYDHALFQRSRHTGRDARDDRRAWRSSALRALDLFKGQCASANGTALVNAGLEPAEVRSIVQPALRAGDDPGRGDRRPDVE